MNKYLDVIEKIASASSEKRLNKIRIAGNNTKLIQLSYLDAKKNKTKRFVEPYKLTPDDFWAFDVSKDSIRRFKVKNIKGVALTNKKYEPRWNIEIESPILI